MITRVEQITGDSAEDTMLLREMAEAARSYISAFAWALPIAKMSFAFGIGGVVALFLVGFEGKVGGTDRRLWVVAGDLPSAYLVVEKDDSAREALERYCQLIDGWIDAVTGSRDPQDAFPVDAPRTQANAESLRRRTKFLREEIIPQAPADLIDG